MACVCWLDKEEERACCRQPDACFNFLIEYSNIFQITCMDKKEQRKEQEVAQSWRSVGALPSFHPAMTLDLLVSKFKKRGRHESGKTDGMETEGGMYNVSMSILGIIACVFM